MLNGIALVLTLLQTILQDAKAKNAAQEVVAGIEAAIEKLISVQGTPVTYGELESLRVTPEW